MTKKTQNIFIHIPKTGGTTINCAMNNSEWQTSPDFNYRHINYETKRSNAADIFNPLKHNLYAEYSIFMLLRHPVDRLLSEYSFIKTRPEFMSLIKPVPKDFNSYIKSKQTQNYMIGFLLGKRMYDTDYVTEDDMTLVKNTIRNLNIRVGIFEQYEASLSYFSNFSNLKWPKSIDIKRITLNRPSVTEISEEVKKLILKNNALDLELYNYALGLFNEKVAGISKKKIAFKGDKYDYVLKFTQRFNLLETTLTSLDFLKTNTLFFEKLNDHLHHNLRIKDGKNYVELWNKAFIDSLNINCSETTLAKDILNTVTSEDPLEKNIQIGNCINRSFKPTSKNIALFKNKLSLDTTTIKTKTKKFKWF
ncbi:sulfotransferase family 2 domain-containing protein [Patiriisocius sp. Uisw_047]|jgi:hypothetical protein|uniref:sulfotransferase family 2 domain-containing protein n=1 Tax=Patiriisocius sp. Uisw_047 TaxID=3230969 RepID=UPI0039EC9899